MGRVKLWKHFGHLKDITRFFDTLLLLRCYLKQSTLIARLTQKEFLSHLYNYTVIVINNNLFLTSSFSTLLPPYNQQSNSLHIYNHLPILLGGNVGTKQIEDHAGHGAEPALVRQQREKDVGEHVGQHDVDARDPKKLLQYDNN